MDIPQVVRFLDHPEEAEAWLRSLNVVDAPRALGNLQRIAKGGVTIDLMAVLFRQLERHLGQTSDPDMALNNLERFVAVARSPLSLISLMERDSEALPILLQIFSTSQHMSDLLVRDPESYDLLRITEGQPVTRDVLVAELCSEISALKDERAVMASLRRYKHRETLRIAYGDIIRNHGIAVVSRQISYLSDAICEAALQFARRTIEEKRGVPRRADGQPARFVTLALGKLGGVELNYSSDIDLMMLYDADGKTDGDRSIGNAEFFERVTRLFVKLLTEPTGLGICYRVDLRLRPEGAQGQAVISLESALHYYDVMGRTWERQAFVKARPVAGDLQLGRHFLDELQPWIYRRYLSRADITGIKALKRRIEQRARREGGDVLNVKTGRGGIRDVEFVIQFLQLLNGGDLKDARTGNTLEAITQLEDAGCLTLQERTILEQTYTFLRKLEHRLQMMFDLQTHTLPDDDVELRKLAIRMGYPSSNGKTALEAFKADHNSKRELNRKILDHLLHDAFGEQDETEPEVDLVLDPDPSPETIHEVLAPYRFQDVPAAYQNLMALATEKIPFLSTRRCRHFLASIAPHLLQGIAATPDPDFTLVNLAKVSESLGGKGVLWELFSFSPPTLKLYIYLCSTSTYLSGILTSNPGMIDELMDSLVLDKLPSLQWMDETLTELCRGAEDIDPILHSFKNSLHLRVGVRDILAKEDVRNTHRALSDVAEVCLKKITLREYSKLIERFGEPIIKGGPRDGEPCSMIILALGKLGGREPNYHSDLDVVFLFESDGETLHRRPEKATTNQHFFSQLAQRIIKVVTGMGPYGRLYELDPRLRPTGKSGSLAVSLDELKRYFDEGQGQLWERQALCKARVVLGPPEACEQTMHVVREIITGVPWRPSFADEIRHMRHRLEDTATPRNLKRGRGGTVDIEFAVQMLQLKHAVDAPEVLVPGTLDALDALHTAGHLSDDDFAYFTKSYRFLRNVEARLRLMNTTARHDLPDDPAELARLAFLLEFDSTEQLLAAAERSTSENRVRFDRIFDNAAR
ncbi:MAG: bifunctional [glutamate--ammonia ligase]-adenylyl-L-tyrosine phosphorylase/[glutamate--ammonia-ligase] adenylyltransferase [Pirellulaceae bacterium]